MVFKVEEMYARTNTQMCGAVWCTGTRPGVRKRSAGVRKVSRIHVTKGCCGVLKSKTHGAN